MKHGTVRSPERGLPFIRLQGCGHADCLCWRLAKCSICLIVIWLTLACAAPCYSEEAPIFIQTIGSSGGADGHLLDAHGLGVAPSGNIFVANSGNRRIEVFGASGQFLYNANGAGSETGSFGGPIDVSVASGDTVYVSDGGNLDVFGPAFQYLRHWTGPLGCIALDPSGRLLYSTIGTYVYVYRISDGVLIHFWRCANRSPGQQVGLGIGPSGTIYVPGDGYVQKFSPDGVFLGHWQPPSGAIGSLTVDDQENVYVLSGSVDGDLLSKCSSDGTLLFSTLVGDNGSVDIALDQAHRYVYVLTQGGSQVRQFGYASVPTARRTWGALKALYR